jgi:hypothetical protein
MNEIGKERPTTEGRDDKGRFGPGNPGRPLGARNRATAAAQAVLDDGIGEVAKKCLELALEGDTACLLALLKLRIPANREVPAQEPIELPALGTPKEALVALRTIAEAAARGDIDSDHARSLVAIVEALLKSFEVVDLDERIRALEAQAQGGRREAA